MWVILVIVSFAAFNYKNVKTTGSKIYLFEKGQGGSGQQNMQDQIDAAANDKFIGFLFSCFNIGITCFAAIYSELVMKKQKSLKFYAQKFYFELTGLMLLVFIATVKFFNTNESIAQIFPNDKFTMFSFSFIFNGWNFNAFIILYFISFCLKSWFIGLVTKRLDSIVARMVNVVILAYLYFFQKIHSCHADDSTGEFPSVLSFLDQKGEVQYRADVDFFCPRGLFSKRNGLTQEGFVSACLLIFAIVAYAFAQSDFKKMILQKEQLSVAVEVAKS